MEPAMLAERHEAADPVSAFDDACDRVESATADLLEALAEIDRTGLWRGGAATSLHGWVVARRGVAWGTAREWVRIAGALTGLPAIAAAYRAGRMSFDQLRPVTLFATPADDEEWAHRAGRYRPRTLYQIWRRRRRVEIKQAESAHAGRTLDMRWDEDERHLYFEGVLAGEQAAAFEGEMERRAKEIAPDEDAIDPRGARFADALVEAVTSGDGAGGQQVLVLHADASVLVDEGSAEEPEDGEPEPVEGQELGQPEDQEPVTEQAPPPLAETESGVRLPEETIRRIACEAQIEWVLERDGRTVGIGRQSRRVPPWLARMVRFRDMGCRFEGCPNRKHVHIHHLIPWARGGPTDLGNLVTLCTAHHRKVHEGRWRILGDPAGELTVHPPVPVRARAGP